MTEDHKYLRNAIFMLKLGISYPINSNHSLIFKLIYKLWQFLFIFSFASILVQSTIYFSTQQFDLITDSELIIHTAIYFCAALNLILFNTKQKLIEQLSRKIDQYFVEKSDNEFEKLSMHGAGRIANLLPGLWAFIGGSSALVAAVMPFLSEQRILLINTWHPYNATASPQFELTVLWQIYTQINMIIIYAASDSIYLVASILMAQQFRILGSNLKYTVHTSLIQFGYCKNEIREILESNSLNYQQNEQEFSKLNLRNFNQLLEHHQLLVGICKDINQIFSEILLVKMCAAIMYVVFEAFTILNIDDDSVMFGLIFYITTSYTQILIYTIGGQIFTNASDFSLIYHEIPWYLCDNDWKKNYAIAQIQMIKSLNIRAGNYFTMSLPTFLAITKAIGSYLTLLRELTKN